MAKKAKKKKKPFNIHKLYEKKGEALSRKTRFCDKCGPGFFMAAHKGRFSCGKCKYTVFESKKKEESKA